jgi:hypothetical protein
MIDALLDARKSQKKWLKQMGVGIGRLGALTVKLNRLLADPIMRQDKIPKNALTGLTNSWIALNSPIHQMRLLGSTRAEQALKVDTSVLKLVSVLRNASLERHCTSEEFRMRYAAQTCASLRVQLSVAHEARLADMRNLEVKVMKMITTASRGLIEHECNAPPRMKGCWLRLPKGCPKLPTWTSADKWTRDLHGELATGAASSENVCTINRKMEMSAFCGTSDVEMYFHPGPTGIKKMKA